MGLKPKVMQTKVKGTSIVINKNVYASAVVDRVHSVKHACAVDMPAHFDGCYYV